MLVYWTMPSINEPKHKKGGVGCVVDEIEVQYFYFLVMGRGFHRPWLPTSKLLLIFSTLWIARKKKFVNLQIVVHMWCNKLLTIVVDLYCPSCANILVPLKSIPTLIDENNTWHLIIFQITSCVCPFRSTFFQYKFQVSNSICYECFTGTINALYQYTYQYFLAYGT